MANAAAKKAAAAKAATANIYQPILLVTNLLYILLLIGIKQEWTFWLLTRMVVNWGLQAFAYLSILDQATNTNTINNNTTNNSANKALVGGVHLDLLALTILIQFGSTLHSTKWFYLLVMVPLWGGWTLYSTFLKGRLPMWNNGSGSGSQSSSSGMVDDKRLKRASSKRSQK